MYSIQVSTDFGNKFEEPTLQLVRFQTVGARLDQVPKIAMQWCNAMQWLNMECVRTAMG